MAADGEVRAPFTASLAASCPRCYFPFGMPLPSRRHLEVPRLTYSNRKSDVPIADEGPWPLCWATYDQLGKRHACTKDQPGVRDSGLEKVVSSLFNNRTFNSGDLDLCLARYPVPSRTTPHQPARICCERWCIGDGQVTFTTCWTVPCRAALQRSTPHSEKYSEMHI